MNILSQIKKKFNKNKTNIEPQNETMLFDAVNMDINNICNQRCRFCFSSFEDKPVNMDVYTFERMIEVLPLVKNYAGGGYGFYISCIYEPTISPNFLECLSILPEIAKKKCFFTTNFVKPMDEEYINAMISANIGLINISIESLKSERFEYITRNSKFHHYKNNLDILEKILKDKDEIPQFRFITMLLEENSDEIIDLIKYCQDHFPVLSHEIRTPYISIYNNMKWNENQLMPQDKVDKLSREIKSLGYPVDMDIKSIDDLKILNNHSAETPLKNNQSDIYAEAKKRFLEVEDHEYLFLRINPDGTCTDKIHNEPIPISKENSRKFFEDKLYELYLNRAKAAYCENYEKVNSIDADAFILIDKLSQNEAYIEFTGWCCPDREVDIDKLIIKLVGNNGDTKYFHASTKKRPDADEFKNKNEGWCGGFTTYIENNLLNDNSYSVCLLYKDKSGQTISYTWENLISV